MASINLDQYERDDDDELADEYDDDYGNQAVGGYERDDIQATTGQMASLPSELKGLRACMVCTLVKTMNQFLDEGCDNCERFLQMRDRQDRVMETTSNVFEGLAAVHQPNDSWVAKYQGLQMLKPGCYALEVTGVMSPEIDNFLKNKNIPYRAKPPANMTRQSLSSSLT